MADRAQNSTAAGIMTVVAGAGAGGLVAWFVAPALFPAALIGGALIAGAARVAWVLARSGSDKTDGSS